MKESGLDADPEFEKDPATMWDEFDDNAPGFADLEDLSRQFHETVRLRRIEHLHNIDAEHQAVIAKHAGSTAIDPFQPEPINQLTDPVPAEPSNTKGKTREQDEQTKAWTPVIPRDITLVSQFKTEVAANDDQSRPGATDDQGSFEIDWIGASGYKRGRGKQVTAQVLVKWKGWPVEDASWEPLASMSNDVDLTMDREELIEEVKDAAENDGLNLRDGSAPATTAQKRKGKTAIQTRSSKKAKK